jgi:GTPase SAR1 family protein
VPLVKNHSHNKDEVNLVLVGTKFDLVDDREVSQEEGQSLASALSACYFTECSAISELSVQGFFAKLGEELFT